MPPLNETTIANDTGVVLGDSLIDTDVEELASDIERIPNEGTVSYVKNKSSIIDASKETTKQKKKKCKKISKKG